MKKTRRARITAALLLTLTLALALAAAGCADKEETEGGLRFAYSKKADVEADYQRAREAWNWFFVEPLPLEKEPIVYQGAEYYKVQHDQLKTMDDLKTYLGYIFSKNLVDEMIAYGPYLELDGALCMVPAERDNEIRTSVVSGAAVKDDAGWNYTVRMNVIDPYDEKLIYGTKDIEGYSYTMEDWHWLFTGFPEPSGPNRLTQREMRSVGESMDDIKALLRTVVKSFQKNDYDTLMPLVRDDSVHDKSTLESYRNLVTEQFGDDAWLNTSYVITDLTEPEGDFNVCKVALTFNGQGTSALGYRDFYFYITDEYGPWKLTDVSSFSFDPYYGGRSKPSYFFAKEAKYRGITINTTEKELLAKLGAPETSVENLDLQLMSYRYSDAEYIFYRTDQAESGSVLGAITVYGGIYETVRGIKLGDTVEDAIHEFPIEKDHKQEPVGVLFGKDILEGQGGYLDDDVLIVTSENINPSVKLEFVNGEVNRVYYAMIPMT